MPDGTHSPNELPAPRPRPVRGWAIGFVAAAVLGAMAWGESQGGRTFGHVQVVREGAAGESFGDATAVVEGGSLRVTIGGSAPVTLVLPWPSGVADTVTAEVRSVAGSVVGRVSLEEVGRFVAGRFEAVWPDGVRVAGGFRSAVQDAASTAIAGR